MLRPAVRPLALRGIFVDEGRGQRFPLRTAGKKQKAAACLPKRIFRDYAGGMESALADRLFDSCHMRQKEPV